MQEGVRTFEVVGDVDGVTSFVGEPVGDDLRVDKAKTKDVCAAVVRRGTNMSFKSRCLHRRRETDRTMARSFSSGLPAAR